MAMTNHEIIGQDLFGQDVYFSENGVPIIMGFGSFHRDIYETATNLWNAIKHADNNHLHILLYQLRIDGNCTSYIYNSMPMSYCSGIIAMFLLNPLNTQGVLDYAKSINPNEKREAA